MTTDRPSPARARESGATLELAVDDRLFPLQLELHDGAGIRVFPVRTGTTTVGTSPACDVVVDDRAVSARHLSLECHPDGVLVRDLGSKNGTFVGGARVHEAWVGQGAALVAGRSVLTLVSSASHDDERAGAPLEGMRGESGVMRRLAGLVRRLSTHSFPVLVAGESGTGKELVARALHDEGPRKGRPFVVLNVAALPRELVESELFGHERGAFTGAVARRAGAFAEAEGGTLFLDEIGELPLEAQPKLLRALDGYEVRRVGGSGSGRRTDVRVVAATCAPLESLVAEGRFRRDLYHRLEVFIVRVPPLRERAVDIAAIAKGLLRDLADEFGPRELSPSATSVLLRHPWPGNVRELRNVLYRAMDRTAGRSVIDAADVEAAFGRPAGPRTKEVTPRLAKALLAEHEHNITRAARAAGVPRTSFRKLVAS
ncbi:MAG: sigma 54-interacting transcriptional regulator [Polyangiaceae bacterium]